MDFTSVQGGNMEGTEDMDFTSIEVGNAGSGERTNFEMRNAVEIKSRGRKRNSGKSEFDRPLR